MYVKGVNPNDKRCLVSCQKWFIQQPLVLQLQHSIHPTVTDVLDVEPLFERNPYNLDRLSVTYVVSHVGAVSENTAAFVRYL